MEAFGQHASCSQLGYSYTEDWADMEIFFGDHFTQYLHQQNLHQPQSSPSMCGVTDDLGPNDDPFWWLDDSINNSSSCLTGNGSGDLLSDHENSQAQVLTPAKSVVPEIPCLPPVNHEDVIQIEKPCYATSAVIAMALQSAPEKMLTLRKIYSYVLTNFPFYNKSKTNWKKGIRSKLTKLDCFKKVAMDSGSTGRNNYWIFDPNCNKTLDDVNFKLKWKKSINGSKPSKELDHKKNVKSLRSDRLMASPESKIWPAPQPSPPPSPPPSPRPFPPPFPQPSPPPSPSPPSPPTPPPSPPPFARTLF